MKSNARPCFVSFIQKYITFRYGSSLPKKNVLRKWSQEDLEKAMEAVRGGMSQRDAANQFNIPKSTLGDYCSGRSTLGTPLGRAPAIPAKVIIHMFFVIAILIIWKYMYLPCEQPCFK